jgi:aspartyl-tRNA synthetase
MMFLPVRDTVGTTQIILDGDMGGVMSLLDDITPESIICVKGIVKARTPDAINKVR